MKHNLDGSNRFHVNKLNEIYRAIAESRTADLESLLALAVSSPTCTAMRGTRSRNMGTSARTRIAFNNEGVSERKVRRADGMQYIV